MPTTSDDERADTDGSKVRRRRRVPRQIVFHVTMCDIEPPIWRRFRVPDRYTLHQLHRVLTIVFCRLDYHIYEFQIGDRRFDQPEFNDYEPAEDASAVTLAALDLAKGDHVSYTYDFGDGWTHDMLVERFLPMPRVHGPDWTPDFIDGARAAPPEDAGGPHAYERFCQALRDPLDPEHDEFRRWVGPHFDPELFDCWSMSQTLSLVAAGWEEI